MGATKAGATAMTTTSLLPLELEIAAEGVRFRARDTIHVWGGERTWATEVDTPGARVSPSSPGGVDPLVVVLVHIPCPTNAGTKQRCRRGRSGGYRSPR